MRQITYIKTGVVLLGIVAGAGVVAYYTLLNERARTELKRAIKTVGNSYHQLYGMFEDNTGIIMEDDKETLPNRIATELQWEALGF